MHASIKCFWNALFGLAFFCSFVLLYVVRSRLVERLIAIDRELAASYSRSSFVVVVIFLLAINDVTDDWFSIQDRSLKLFMSDSYRR